jgi:hypothetical protein
MSPQPYVPDALPLSNLDYRLLLPLVGQANAALARHHGLLLRSRPGKMFEESGTATMFFVERPMHSGLLHFLSGYEPRAAVLA